MVLVDYSDSDGSDTEQPPPAAPPKPITNPSAKSNSNFSIDRANPQKIRVKLADTAPANGTHEEEPSAKRPRIGAGGFSGFNSMLPPPKRDADSKSQPSTAKGTVRKVFSLKTGAEPGFSRESDAELKNFFADQDTERESLDRREDDHVGTPDLPKKTLPQQPVKGAPILFKPLSVGKNSTKKKKSVNSIARPITEPSPVTATSKVEAPPPPPKKVVSLFSMGQDKEPDPTSFEPPDEDDDPIPAFEDDEYQSIQPPSQPPPQTTAPQNLSSIASDLNLSAAERRQLFGRNSKSNNSAVNISNFNTDAEYLANEELRATGEQTQHNPLRAIAPGKHSLKQLISQAQTQKDALEESFASGKRNKKEAGGKYGW